MSGHGQYLSQQPAQRMTQTMQRALGLLQLDNAELSGLLIEEAARNPNLQVTLPMPELTPQRRRPWVTPGSMAGAGDFDPDRFGAQVAGLYGHVQDQIGLVFNSARDRQIAEVFVAALEPSGWLGESVDEVARTAGCTPEQAAQVLEKLQGIEPTGLFARSLSECLALQLAEAEALTPPMQSLLDNLPALARGDTGALIQRCAVDAEELGRMVALLRSLDPKPGAQFDTSPALRRAPDLVVSRDELGEWQVALNRASTPEVRVVRLAEPDSKEGLETARWLERTLSRRNQMILRVAGYVIAYQHAFLDHGRTRLKPLTSGEVGAALGLHETTVGRIRAGLLMQLPKQVLPLRDFFGRGRVTCQTGESLAGDAIAAMIAELVAVEPPDAPLSDARMVDILKGRGIILSRRTLANWRTRAGIAPASERKRAATGRLDKKERFS
ncbi:RNA polymerase sigma-54 factor [Actibacterium sp.]|uniref:RNA polymerase factor sigma-54 n=1 Tax=Actibacterium sp. TaxID=1872125 RepID=UPI0035691916